MERERKTCLVGVREREKREKKTGEVEDHTAREDGGGGGFAGDESGSGGFAGNGGGFLEK